MPSGQEYFDLARLIKKNNLHTVCQEANCPNIAECFGKKTATFMVLGSVCTRGCKYCNVSKGNPGAVDPGEPKKVAEAVKKLGLSYAVITSVTRDDLKDGGAFAFAETIGEIRKKSPGCRVEVLIPDFAGNKKALDVVLGAKPDVLNHNIEVVKRLFQTARPQGDYERSLNMLRDAKKCSVTKSGFMVGLGETKEEINETMRDLCEIADILTIGQYLQPTKEHIPVAKYYTPDEFKGFKELAMKMGFRHVESGPLVRSSYHAGEYGIAKKEKIRLRLLDTKNSSAAMNMAIDEAVMLSGTPTLRFYGWEPPAVSIGYFQGIEQEVDLAACKRLGVDVVRRLTGGGAVFHDKELTYSIIIPEKDNIVSRNILESYGQICGFVVEGLRKLGLPAEFKPINDIVVNGKKVSGNAQTRRGGMILQHGTVLLEADVKKMFSILKVPDEKIRDKMIAAVEERVTSVEREAKKKIGFKETKAAMIKAFKEGFDLAEGELSKEELGKAAELSKSKYSKREWNFMR